MKATLKPIGSFIIAIAVMVGIGVVALMLIGGGVWLSDKLYPWLIGLSALSIAVSIFILLPLAAFKKTRGFSGMGFFIVSYVFGATLWVWSLLLTYVLWGGFALFLGLFLGGIGVLPIAMLATAFKGLWSLCGQLIVLAIITYATRAFGIHLASKAEEDAPEPDPIATASRNLFSAASDAFDAAYASGETHTTRANHRYTIRMAARSSHDADAYNEEIAGYTEPTDFDPYTDADLDAHTAAIESIATAFDRLTAAFGAFGRTDHLYKSAAAVYKATTALYVFATDAYSRAAHCAMTTALEGNLQAAKDDFEIMLLETRAANAAPIDATAATAKAAAYKANATKNAAAAKRLEQRATEAQARAEALCANARSATANAEEALEGAQ